MLGDKGIGFPTDGFDNNGWKLYITSLVMIISAGLFVIARCAARYQSSKLGWDDAAITVSLLSSIVLSTAMQLAIQHGYGMHKADLTKKQLRDALRFFFIAQTPYKVTVCLNKVAVILLYLRLFPSRNFRIASITVMGIIVAWSIGGVGATIFQCVPIAGAWDKSVNANCIDSGQFWIAYAVMNILTDIMVLALPIMPVMRLQMNIRDRLLLCSVFLLGGFVTITSILRTTSVQNSLKNKADTTYNFIERGIWTLIEANLGIIVACLPAVKKPLGKLFPRIFGYTRKVTGYKSSSNTHGASRNGYKLSNVSASTSQPGVWTDGKKSQHSAAVNSPVVIETKKSDEIHIITESLKGSDPDVEMDNRTDKDFSMRHAK